MEEKIYYIKFFLRFCMATYCKQHQNLNDRVKGLSKEKSKTHGRRQQYGDCQRKGRGGGGRRG